MKTGDIYRKTKDTGGFRGIGHEIKIIKVMSTMVEIQHLPITEGILGNEIDYYGIEHLESNYSPIFHNSILSL